MEMPISSEHATKVIWDRFVGLPIESHEDRFEDLRRRLEYLQYICYQKGHWEGYKQGLVDAGQGFIEYVPGKGEVKHIGKNRFSRPQKPDVPGATP